MSLVSDKLFDVNDIKPKEIDEYIHKLHLEYDDNSNCKTICPACGDDKYKFAFDKYKFHYVECQTCRSLYVQNTIEKIAFDEYTQKLAKNLYSSDRYSKYIDELTKRSYSDLEITFSRFMQKNTNHKIAYTGNKEAVFANALQNFDTTMINANFEDDGLDAKFDFIIIDHGLEKTSDLSKYISNIYQALNDKGHVYILSRLGSGIDILTLWEDSKVYPIEHQNLLSVDGIKILMNQNGFNIKGLNTPGILDVDNILNSASSNIPRFLQYLKNFGRDEALEDFRVFIQKNLLSSFATIVAQKEVK